MTKIKGRRIRLALSQSVTEARCIRDEYLRELKLNGRLSIVKEPEEAGKLFGEMAQEWVSIISKEIKLSTLSDYRYSMNRYILPRFGNVPIAEINYLDIRKFVSTLGCSRKRINNILVPMRSVLKMAYLSEIIEKNPMDRVKNVKTDKPDIHPLSMEEVRLFLDNVSERFRNFFVVAFFTGMRFGEMACLKWQNVDFRLGVIKVRETRVMGEEGRPKTKKSTRDIKILPPVREALQDQRKQTFGKSDYVFLNQYGKNIDPVSMNFHVWKKGLKKAGLAPRSLYQTRHTFATLMLDAGEHPGWVQKMMGHETMQMIYEKYYSYIKNYDRDEGSAFMERVFTQKTDEDAPKQVAIGSAP
ncbi:MAG: tyrosine-type recombinase/integrase [Syntrophales bacterium]|nr:tyrosine-type recombinase/integrase [Syntrophales bacterium]